MVTLVFILQSCSAFASQIELNDLAFPTELQGIGKSPGAIFYSPSSKNKTLMPVHFWGEVGRPGLHFIPVDTRLIKGLSLAGGGSSTAKLEEVIVNRQVEGKIKRKEFNLGAGGDIQAHEFALQPGDTIFIKKDRFIENRNFYIGLTSVVVTILTSVLLYKRIEDSK